MSDEPAEHEAPVCLITDVGDATCSALARHPKSRIRASGFRSPIPK